jgi:chromosome partitioning protein
MNMRKVVVINFKGGVGKTTTSVNVAHGLAMAGNRVLLVDNDPQANSTFIFNKPYQYSLTDLFKNLIPVERAIISVKPCLDLIPAAKSLSTINSWLIEKAIPQRARVLERILAGVTGYDFIIVDTAPSFSLLNANAISFASEAWVPVAMEYLALANIKELVHIFTRAETHLSKPIDIKYVIPYFVDLRNKKSHQILHMLGDIFGEALTNPIHTNVKISEAPFHFKTVLEYDPESRGAKDFQALIRRILQDNHQGAQAV